MWRSLLKGDPLQWLLEEDTPAVRHWEARAITGEEGSHYYRSATSGPGFCCAANGQLPCAWVAIKALLALARIPREQRAPQVERAIEQEVAFLFSCDPVTAAYPRGVATRTRVNPGSNSVSRLAMSPMSSRIWSVLCELGFATDIRLHTAITWLLSKQDAYGRWSNEYAYPGKTWVDIETQVQLSKWVTLRACAVLKLVYG